MWGHSVPTKVFQIQRTHVASVLYTLYFLAAVATCRPSIAVIAVSGSLCLEFPVCPEGKINVWQFRVTLHTWRLNSLSFWSNEQISSAESQAH